MKRLASLKWKWNFYSLRFTKTTYVWIIYNGENEWKKMNETEKKMYHSSKMHSCILQYHCVCKYDVILYIPFWSPQRRIQFLRFRCCCLRHGEGDFWVLSEYRKAQQIMSLFYTSKLSSIFIVLSFIQGTLLRSELILCTDLIWVYSNAK